MNQLIPLSHYQTKLVLEALGNIDVYKLGLGEYMEYAMLLEKLDILVERYEEVK
jgi:hypothetical protein